MQFTEEMKASLKVTLKMLEQANEAYCRASHIDADAVQNDFVSNTLTQSISNIDVLLEGEAVYEEDGAAVLALIETQTLDEALSEFAASRV